MSISTLHVVLLVLRTMLKCMPVRFTTQTDERTVFFYYTDTTGHPWRPQLIDAMRKGAIRITTDRVEIMPTLTRPPMKTFGFVMSLFTTAKTRNLPSRGGRSHDIIAYSVGVNSNANCLTFWKIIHSLTHTHTSH